MRRLRGDADLVADGVVNSFKRDRDLGLDTHALDISCVRAFDLQVHDDQGSCWVTDPVWGARPVRVSTSWRGLGAVRRCCSYPDRGAPGGG